jgi:hypothetical protein
VGGRERKRGRENVEGKTREGRVREGEASDGIHYVSHV